MMGRTDDLTAERLRSHLSYDVNSGVFTWKARTPKGNFVKVGDVAGTKDGYGYVVIRISRRAYKAHRLAWLYVYGEWPKALIDHRDGVRDNNRLSNLREATRAQNQQNQKTHKDNRTGLKGVCRDRRAISKPFSVQIQANGKLHHIGTFSTETEAQAAYCDAAKRLHGEFARAE